MATTFSHDEPMVAPAAIARPSDRGRLFVGVSVGRLPVARTEMWYAVTDALVAFG